MEKNIILNHEQIQHKIARIAYQILESFGENDPIVLAGIAAKGYTIARHIAQAIQHISEVDCMLCEVFVDKNNPLNKITTSLNPSQYENKNVVVIDDVLHSGATLIYAIKHFLEVPLQCCKTAVLVDRNHKKYPVKVDFKGISLSTSLKEHVEVTLEENNSYAVLL